jgi:hypothetical protein
VKLTTPTPIDPPNASQLATLEIGTIAQWFAGLATLAAVLWAVFSQGFLRWFRRPRLDLEPIVKESQDCVSVPFANGAPTIHMRVRVKNNGRAAARNVQVYADTVERAEGKYWEIVPTFPALNLTWADRPDLTPSGGVLPWLPSRESRRSDLGHIVDPGRRRDSGLDTELNPTLKLNDDEVSFTFSTVIKPNHKGYIIPPGTYRLSISLSAENAAPQRRSITLTVHGPWYQNPEEMIEKGFDIEIGPGVHPRQG